MSSRKMIPQQRLVQRDVLRTEAVTKALEISQDTSSEHLHLLGFCGGFPPGSLIWIANFDAGTFTTPSALRVPQRTEESAD